MTVKNKVIAGAVALAIGVGSYLGINARSQNLAEDFARQNEPIVGTVLAESYKNTLVPNPERNGLVSYSNETVKLEPKYTLKVRTDDGRTIGVSIINSEPYGTATKESLDALIDEGTRISFPRGNMRATNFFVGSGHNYDKRETSFQDDTQMGTKRAYRVQVLDKE
jgi:hypothetical protein|tara:strand:- start:15 stop:512 length:498 start_codon:yes stop_codon:yes gene_type:complete